MRLNGCPVRFRFVGRFVPILILVIFVISLTSCAAEQEVDAAAANRSDFVTTDAPGQQEEVAGMKISSRAFGPDESIPSKYTCDGEDLNPPLTFDAVPEEAESLALIMDDPDVPPPGSDRVWDHWVVWNLPPTTEQLAEGSTPEGVVGKNSWGRNDWGGPCPPDREHRYFFRLFALDTSLDLPDSAEKKDLEQAMEGHVIASAELMGRYDRNR